MLFGGFSQKWTSHTAWRGDRPKASLTKIPKIPKKLQTSYMEFPKQLRGADARNADVGNIELFVPLEHCALREATFSSLNIGVTVFFAC